MVKEWCGIFTSNFLFKEEAQLRLKLAEYFKTRKWDKGLKTKAGPGKYPFS